MSATIIGWVDTTPKASKPSEQVETTQPKKSSSATKTASKKTTSKKG